MSTVLTQLDIFDFEDIGRFMLECAVNGWKLSTEDLDNIMEKRFDNVRENHF